MNVKEIYNLLHSMPEEGMQEFKTSEYLAKQLEILGYKVTRNIGITGVVGTYNTGVPGPTLAIRADMDALKHLISGEIKFIHSCGHDAHAAMVLVAASRLINNVKKGTLKIVFQPGEETLLGAQAMIKDGLLDDIDIMLGLHLRPIQDASMGQASPGVYHAASAVLDVTIQGLTAHGARPHLGINAIDAAALAILAVNSIRTNPIIACSAKVTAINAGGAASNAIPKTQKISPAVAKLVPNNPTKNIILNTESIIEPSLWKLVPKDTTVPDISSDIPIFLAASRFTGIHAADEHVPTAVTVDGIIFFQNIFNPLLPPAIKA